MAFETNVQPRIGDKNAPYVAPADTKIQFPINSVWVFRTGNQYPVIVRNVTNKVDTASYPRMVTFETVKGEMLTLQANAFSTALTKTDFGAMKFAAIRNALKDVI